VVFVRLARPSLHCPSEACLSVIDADAARSVGPDARSHAEQGAAPSAVRLTGAVCLIARYPVLAGVDLEVAPGEIVLVSGPNGAGKTSLLRLLAGLVPLAAGTAEVLGHDLADGSQRRALRRHLAYLGHETGCYDDLSVRDNLRFAARAVGRADAATAADAMVDTVGLARQAKVAHRRLSAGQRRRLALGVALVRDARLLLLDEPHAGLDADGRDVLEALMRQAAAEGRTVVFSSHELDRARALAHREVRMRAGETRTDPTLAPSPVRAVP
jgi:heme ABC exporter ATP-binding subunit CcmA